MPALKLIRSILRNIVPSHLRPPGYLEESIWSASAGRVVSGPFMGMKYVKEAHCSALLPKILGVYEKELHTVIEEICDRQFALVIDIGAAEGYYAVGLALRIPNTRVITFEMATDAQRAQRKLVELNQVDGRVQVLGECTIDLLRSSLSSRHVLVICDCEGGEDVLLNPTAVEGLSTSHILVETHDFAIPNVTEKLQLRFRDTHAVTTIWQQERTRSEFQLHDWYIDRMQDSDILGVLNESRPWRMRWLWMVPNDVAKTAGRVVAD